MVKTSKKLLTVFEAEGRERVERPARGGEIFFSKRVPHVKLGRSVRIPEEAIDALIDRGWRETIATQAGKNDS